LIGEQRRRAYLDAMQVASWLPRTELPFAAPSRAELLQFKRPPAMPLAQAVPPQPSTVAAPAVSATRPEPVRPRVVIAERKAVAEPAPAAPVAPKPQVAPPRFALQLLRAGNCLLLVELPTGESFQSRDPAYLLLKDMLRAARLPDSPQQVGDGEPIRWPLLQRGSRLEQGAQAARDYVQGVVAAELEQMGCACLWLVGLPALRFAGEAEADACFRELHIEGLGPGLAIPGLEQLMEQPSSKAALWQAMRRSMSRWIIGHE
jgi:hypothetical protein